MRYEVDSFPQVRCEVDSSRHSYILQYGTGPPVRRYALIRRYPYNKAVKIGLSKTGIPILG